MALNLTENARSRVLNWLIGDATTAPTLPLRVRLMTVNGSATVAGTEVVGGSYAPQSLSTGTVAAGAVSNDGVLTFTDMPAATVVGIEVWDSAGTPFRWWWGSLTTPRTFLAGDDGQFPVNELDLSIT